MQTHQNMSGSLSYNYNNNDNSNYNNYNNYNNFSNSSISNYNIAQANNSGLVSSPPLSIDRCDTTPN